MSQHVFIYDCRFFVFIMETGACQWSDSLKIYGWYSQRPNDITVQKYLNIGQQPTLSAFRTHLKLFLDSNR